MKNNKTSAFFKKRKVVGLISLSVGLFSTPLILIVGDKLNRSAGELFITVYVIFMGSLAMFYRFMRCPRCEKPFGYFNANGMFHPGFTIKTFFGFKCVHCRLEVK